MSEVVLINISGQDKPGITCALMDILAGYGARVLDIGQAMIHDTLALGILIRIPEASRRAPVLKDLLFEAHKLNLQVRFTPIEAGDYDQWVAHGGAPRHVLTLLGRRVTAEQIGRIAHVITDQGLNIEDIVRLSGRSGLHEESAQSRACIELTLRGEPRDPDEIKSRFVHISEDLGVDISFQADNFYRRNRRLVVFDMDSTLIQQEVIDELATEAGAGEAVARVTEASMRGEIDFRESLRQRVAALEGLPEETLEHVAERLTLTEGAERLIRTLQLLGYRTAVISGGFSYFGQRLQRQLNLNYVHANELEIIDGRLTGRVKGPIVDGPRKAELLTEIAAQEDINLQQVVAVGDGANDLPMLGLAGLGVAYRAKPVVRAAAAQAITYSGLDSILLLLGIP